MPLDAKKEAPIATAAMATTIHSHGPRTMRLRVLGIRWRGRPLSLLLVPDRRSTVHRGGDTPPRVLARGSFGGRTGGTGVVFRAGGAGSLWADGAAEPRAGPQL
ncbi:hypothetical protein GCM10009528_19430 [Kineococcus aurantiacus]